MRVLIVEDDLTIADFLVKGFKEGGFAVDHAADGEAGAHLAVDGAVRRRDRRPDAAEAGRPEPHPASCATSGIRTPVLILSAQHTVDDRVNGLEAAATTT